MSQFSALVAIYLHHRRLIAFEDVLSGSFGDQIDIRAMQNESWY
jgi:hypothetical protein